MIPLIYRLRQLGCSVTIACSGKPEEILRKEFPDLPFLFLRGYGITYARNGRFFFFKILLQLPGICYSILQEWRWIRRQQRLHGWDLVVSDNRYGLFHPAMRSVIITHQVNPLSGKGWIPDRILRWLSHGMIRRFDHCWIPDEPGAENLSGNLSHGKLPLNARYIGPISRFHPGPAGEEDRLLILISGPEPQRTLFEEKLIAQLPLEGKTVVFVRGRPGASDLPAPLPGVSFVNHLVAAELEQQLLRSSLVIARSGYTTIMDLMRMGKKSVLVPTPGQTEQEYLARHLAASYLCMTATQEVFNLAGTVAKAADYPFRQAHFSFDMYASVIDDCILNGKQ